MLNFLRIAILSCLFLTPLFASPELDDRYAFRRTVPLVINPLQQPIFAETVEGVMIEQLRANGRFEFWEEEYVPLRSKVRTLAATEQSGSSQSLAPYAAMLGELPQSELQSLFLARIVQTEQGPEVRIALLNARTGGLVKKSTALVRDAARLESYASATREAMDAVVRLLPFQATVLSRDGSRVVLDRGAPELRRGMQIPTFTIEGEADSLSFHETGIILVTQADKTLSFAKVISDRRPLEIQRGQKVLVGKTRFSEEGMKIASRTPSRDLASTTVEAIEGPRKASLGAVGLGLGASLVSIHNSGSNGVVTNTGSTFYPSANLSAELNLTGRVFAETAFQFSTGRVSNALSSSNAQLNSTVTQFRLLLGYRLGSLSPDAGPTFHFRGGYAQAQYAIDSTPPPILFTTQKYTGLLLGGGARLPVAPQFGFVCDLNALMFPSISESPVTSGSESSASTGWDLSLGGYYRVTSSIDVDLKLAFQTNSAQFSGTGSREIPLYSSSQSTYTLWSGMAYRF